MKSVRLLIADDNPQNLQFLSDSLSDDFCTVGTVSDGKALIAAAVALDPHIIITDLPTSLDAVRQLENLMPDIKIIVLTDHEEPEVATSASAVLIQKGVPDLHGKIRALIQDFLTAHSSEFTETGRAYENDHVFMGKGGNA